MTARDFWVSPQSEEDWNDFWIEFFQGEQYDEVHWKDNEKRRYRLRRRSKRKAKKELLQINAKCVSHRSKYRKVENGKNKFPAKPNMRREINFLNNLNLIDYNHNVD